jgi:N-methylhydantoinase B
MIDPVDAAVVRAALVSAAREAFAQFQRTAMLPILYESNDFSISIFDDRLELIADAPGVPEFVGSLSASLEAVLERFGGSAQFRRGDVLIANEPHLTGAHPPDALLLAPAFAGEILVGYCGMRAHMGDLGGRSTCPVDASTVWEEGLQLPPSLLVAAGKPNEGLLAVVASNTRQPREVTGNLRSGAAAMTRGAGKIGSLVDRFGVATYRVAVDQLLDAAEHEARDLLDAIPDGEYSASEMVELPDGAAAVPIQCLVRVKGSDITIDVTGSAPEQPCSLNVPLPQTISACRLSLKRLTTQDTMTANSGEQRMLTVVAPEGCIFNARPPAGCFMMANTASLLGEMVVNVLSPLLPSRRMAQSGGNTTGFLGWMPSGPRGKPTEVDDLAAIGYGATPERDGMNALLYHSLAGMEVASGEVIEARANVSKRRLELVTDSGGPGRRRGGLGTRTEWQVHDYVTLQVQAQKTENVGGLGLAGGGPAGGSNTVVIDPGAANERILGMTADIEAPAGITIVMNGAGGGGYGDPMEREIEAVEDDVRDGYVSIDAAAEHYGVVFSERTGRVDEGATRALREAALKNGDDEEMEDAARELRESDQRVATERKP